jgi:CheY-like chemotaxis protein
MSIRLATVAANGLALDERIRVMVVDDAAVVRSTIGRWVEAEPDLEMVGLLRGAAEAIEQVKRQNPMSSFSTSPCRKWMGSPLCLSFCRRSAILSC